MDVASQDTRLDMETLNLQLTDSAVRTQNSTLTQSMPSFQNATLNSTDPILTAPSIQSGQSLTTIIDQNVHPPAENPIDLMIVDEERPRNGMEGEHNQMNEGYQYLPQYIYSNSDLIPNSLLGDSVVSQEEESTTQHSLSSPETYKRPRTAYNFFSKEFFGNLRSSDPTRPSTEIIKELSVKWKSLSEEEKHKYIEYSKQDKERYENERLLQMKEKKEAGIPCLNKTREKQAFLYEAIESHNYSNFAAGVLMCMGNNKARAVDLLQQVRSQLIRMLQQPNEQIPMTDVDLSKMYDTFPVNQQYIQQVSYHDIHQMPVMHPFVQSEHVNSIPLQTIPSMNPMETEEPLPSKKYICTYEGCNQEYATSSGLYKHKQKHIHPEVLYTCNIDGCNKQYKTKYGLSLHQQNKHSDDKPYHCSMCGKGFVRKSDNDLHMRRTHSTKKPFVCSKCPKSFASQYELTRHLKIHSIKDYYVY